MKGLQPVPKVLLTLSDEACAAIDSRTEPGQPRQGTGRAGWITALVHRELGLAPPEDGRQRRAGRPNLAHPRGGLPAEEHLSPDALQQALHRSGLASGEAAKRAGLTASAWSHLLVRGARTRTSVEAARRALGEWL